MSRQTIERGWVVRTMVDVTTYRRGPFQIDHWGNVNGDPPVISLWVRGIKGRVAVCRSVKEAKARAANIALNFRRWFEKGF